MIARLGERMRVVVQRVSRASVSVDGTVVGRIDRGLLLLVGVAEGDGPDDVAYLARKLPALRIFPGETGRFDRDLRDVGGSLLVVSQFTLYAETRKGRRPDFTKAAPPEQAEPLFDQLVAAFREQGLTVETGRFGAMMEVALVNDGPVTIIVDSRDRELARR